MIYFNDQQDNY